MVKGLPYDVFEGLAHSLIGIPPFQDHGSLSILCQFGCSILEEALGALGLWFSEDRNTVGNDKHDMMARLQKILHVS